jgi:hypothetical protein
MKKLPIAVADFSTIRQRDYIYADKTEFLYNLFEYDCPYFLSRPRRFGKSLLVSTLKAILQKRRELFEGLWIEKSDYDWQSVPVIYLSMNGIETESVAIVKDGLMDDLQSIAEREGLVLRGVTPTAMFKSLFEKLYNKYKQKVAVLIDEYDAPITKQLDNITLANEIRSTLRDFYDVLKAKEEIRGFTFITGVTRFTKTSIFSTLNNLVDLTLNKKYATICGFTISELDNLFKEHMKETLASLKSDGVLAPESTSSELKELILKWYDGYSWDGQTRVLNPWSLLSFFDLQIFDDYWTQSGGQPSFLIKLIQSGQVSVSSLIDEKSINN